MITYCSILGWSYGFTFQRVFLHDRFWTPAPEVGQCQGQITTAGQLGGCQASVRRLETEKKNVRVIKEILQTIKGIMTLILTACFTEENAHYNNKNLLGMHN